MRETGGVTSTWANLPRVTRRCAQAISMPLAWVATLGICAASAFAVRDTVFPTLGESASPSVWEPAPDATLPKYSVPSDVGTPDEITVTVTPTVLQVDLGQGAATPTLPEDSVAPEVRAQSGPPFREVPAGSGSGSGGASSSSSGDAKPSTATTVHSAPATSTPGPSTSAVTATTSASSPSTTDPATTDSIGGSQNGRGSGSGGGGSNDDHP